jgi:DNA-binding MarR family transcriptional regulator
MVNEQELTQIAKKLGKNAEVIANFSKITQKTQTSDIKEQILAVIERRPCDIDGICDGLGIESPLAQENLKNLIKAGLVEKISKNGDDFFIKK